MNPSKSRPDRDRFSRRALLGWFVSLFCAGAVLTLVASAEGVFSYFSELFPRRLRSRPKVGHDRAKQKRLRRKRVNRIAENSANPELVLIENHRPDRRVGTSIVHWPHPKLFRRLLILRQSPPTQKLYPYTSIAFRLENPGAPCPTGNVTLQESDELFGNWWKFSAPELNLRKVEGDHRVD